MKKFIKQRHILYILFLFGSITNLIHCMDIPIPKNYLYLCLFYSVHNGDENAVTFLLKHIKNPDKLDKNGLSALHIAAKKGFSGIIWLLLMHEANVNAIDQNNRVTPLHMAAANGHQAVVRLLLKHGASINQRDEDGFTALHEAVFSGNTNIVNILLEHKAAPDLRDWEDGLTPLHAASWNCHTEIIDALVAHGADINKKSRFGDTACHLTVANTGRSSHERIAVLTCLLHHGVNIHALNAYDRTILEQAINIESTRSLNDYNTKEGESKHPLITFITDCILAISDTNSSDSNSLDAEDAQSNM